MSAVSKVTPLKGAPDEYLTGLAQRVRMWRLREGKSYFSMPSSLWDEDVTAAHKYPLREVSRQKVANGLAVRFEEHFLVRDPLFELQARS